MCIRDRSQPSPKSAPLDDTHTGAALGSDDWLQKCQHHLCTPHQQPASYYTCNLSDRNWSLSFVQGTYGWPSNKGAEVESHPNPTFVHQGWASSIFRGLKDLGPEAGAWNVETSHEKFLGDVIWTANCPRARQAIREKKVNSKFVICGAVGSTFQDPKEVVDPRLGFYIAPSPWVADELRNDPSYPPNSVRARVLVSGVDTAYWAPTKAKEEKKKKKTVVLYRKGKSGDAQGASEVVATLETKGWRVTQVTYGSYTAKRWKELLGEAKAAVFMTDTESQSIALAEAWAMDVPSFVYELNPHHPLFVYSRWQYFANEAPYLNYLNGARWNHVDGLLNLLNSMDQKLLRPREYVLNTMTDAISVKNVLMAIHCEWQRRFPNHMRDG
eukprot:TRINITY_DN39830_c0_g1_i2.p1 TRINITY_DN39830_c0_g1~~TRINITY_DN39830_c0_g1_i2.p1  ORF type:complete len:384 (+),score=72.97 TRINITY_DN39830_c0_g1_i2:92-1243(+)